jgi:hypothetical protein
LSIASRNQGFSVFFFARFCQFLLCAGVRLLSAPLAGRLADVFGAFRLELARNASVVGALIKKAK